MGQCWQVQGFASSQQEAIAALALVPQPCPEPFADGDVVLAVEATEIVWTDSVMATGQYQHRPTLPYSPGMTYSGVVIKTTPKATAAPFSLSVGMRVAVAGVDAGPRSLTRYQRFGGLATCATAQRKLPRARRVGGRTEPYIMRQAYVCASDDRYAVAPCSAIRRVPGSWQAEHACCFAYG